MSRFIPSYSLRACLRAASIWCQGDKIEFTKPPARSDQQGRVQQPHGGDQP